MAESHPEISVIKDVIMDEYTRSLGHRESLSLASYGELCALAERVGRNHHDPHSMAGREPDGIAGLGMFAGWRDRVREALGTEVRVAR